MQALKRLISPLREFGCAAGMIYVVGRLMQMASPRLRLCFYELMAQPIPESPNVDDRVAPGVEVRPICNGDAALNLMPVRPEILASRFKQGALCLGVHRNSQFVGYIWLAFDRYEEDEVRCTFIPAPRGSAVFDFDLYVFPKYRMGRAFLSIWHGANLYLQRHGIKWTYSRINRFNLDSRRAHARLGAVRVARAIFLKAWTMEIMAATIRPYLAVSCNDRRRVALVLEHTSKASG